MSRTLRRVLLGLAAYFALYFALRGTALMQWVWREVTLPFGQWLGRLCGHVSLSMGEVLILAAVWTALIWLANVIRHLCTRPNRLQTLLNAIGTAVCAAAVVYALFCALWGGGFGAVTFRQESGIAAQPSTVAELRQVTDYFARQLTDAAGDVPRDESGVCALSRQEILDTAADAYDPLYDEFPFLDQPVADVKPFGCSQALSVLRFTGFYFPYTGEANVNMDSPAAYFPATVCHEMAHQRGFTAEEECNFVGILAATRSSDPCYRYSGWLVGYVHLSNALYRADYESWQAIRDTLPDTVLADLRANSQYWAQFQGAVSQTAQNAYDALLKSIGDNDGVQSYGMVADLLVTYFKGA